MKLKLTDKIIVSMCIGNIACVFIGISWLFLDFISGVHTKDYVSLISFGIPCAVMASFISLADD